MKSKESLAIWLSLLFAPPAAAAGRPMSLEDLLLAVRVTDARIAPDGKEVAFARTTTDLKAGKRNADIWLVPADGSSPARPLTRHEKKDDSPVFSRDGKKIAF